MHSDERSSKSGTPSHTDRTVVEGPKRPVVPGDEKPSLVIQTAFLGDVILSIPLLKKVKRLRPTAPLYIVVRKGLGQFLKELGLVDGFFEIEKNQGQTYDSLAARLKTVEFKWIFCPHESFRSALFVRSLKAEVKVGFEKWWNFFAFSNSIPKNYFLPDPLRQMSLLRTVDPEMDRILIDPELSKLNFAKPSGELPSIPVWADLNCREQIMRWTDPFLMNSSYVCLFPGSVWNTKRWVPEGFAGLAQQIQNLNLKVIWLGGQDEFQLCAELEKAVPGSQNFAGKTSLTHSLILLARAAAVVSNDSGGQHMATLAGVPVLSIFGPTVLSLGFRPWSSQSMIIENTALRCRPCGKHGHKKCPIGTHECMKSISSQRVLAGLTHLLNRNSPSR